jgi:hypothetical protein
MSTRPSLALEIAEQFADGHVGAEQLAASHDATTPANYWEEGPAHRLTARFVNPDIVIARCRGFAIPRDERVAQCDLIRDIFGNPFRSLSFSPAWRTSTVVSLARGMYDSRAFSAMPILADALQDAGCDNADILNHCRDPEQPHVRGCWVVDLMLGRE